MVEKKQAAWEAAKESEGGDMDMDVDMDDGEAGPSSSSKGKKGVAAVRHAKTNRQMAGMATREQDLKANELRMFAQRTPNRLAKASESDRHVANVRPKWLLAGKRKGGKTQRR